MKILFYIASLGLRGGMECITITKANALAELPGYEVAIAFADDLNYRKTIIRPLSPKVIAIDLKSPFWDDGASPSAFGYLKKLNRLRKALQNTIDDWEPDVVIATGLMDRYVFPFLKQTCREKYIKILEYHFASNYKLLEAKHTSGRINLFRRIQHWFDSRVIAKYYDFNAFLTEEDYLINAPKHDPRFGYIHNPVTFPIEIPDITSPRDKIVLAAGRLCNQKNFASLLRIWAQVKHKDGWRLRILGEGALHDELLNLAKVLNIGDSIEMPGFSSDIGKEMKHASIFAATSAWEGFHLALLEAMASGCPVISYRTPYGPSDIITDNKTGLLVNINDETTYAELLQQMIDKPSFRARLANTALTQIDRFSIPNIIGNWIDKYNSLLAIKRKK